MIERVEYEEGRDVQGTLRHIYGTNAKLNIHNCLIMEFHTTDRNPIETLKYSRDDNTWNSAHNCKDRNVFRLLLNVLSMLLENDDLHAAIRCRAGGYDVKLFSCKKDDENDHLSGLFVALAIILTWNIWEQDSLLI